MPIEWAAGCIVTVQSDGRMGAHMLETKQLRIFKTIVEVGSFTRAGERLHLSQPAISQHVRALEEQVGTPVLLRVGKRVRPTPAGEVILQCAQQVLDRIEDAQRALADHNEGRAGIMRIGCGDAAARCLLPPVLGAFVQLHPKVRLEIVTGHGATIISRLLAGDIDAGVVTLPVEADKIRTADLGRDELVAIVPPGQAWAAAGRARAADFAGRPLVLYERQSGLTEMVLNFLLEEGVFPRVAAEVDQLSAVPDLVRGGLGIAVVPRWAVQDELERGLLRAVALGRQGLTRAWALAHLEPVGQAATVKVLARLCAERMPRLLSGVHEAPAEVSPALARACPP